MGANIFLIPLVLSQAVLRPFFPETTHALMDDWATVSFYLIFFLSGFTLLSCKSMVESVRKQKNLFLIESVIVTVMMFTIPYMMPQEFWGNMTWDILEAFVGWSCGLTAIGYAKQYLNFDCKFRKLANEAIYPFYLLHQPVIVVIGYLVVKLDIAILWKVMIITSSSFAITVVAYLFLIRPFNVLRITFGMKRLQKEKFETDTTFILNPVLEGTKSQLSGIKLRVSIENYLLVKKSNNEKEQRNYRA